ncbi:MAG TPA: hypothetical protein VNA88_01470 [Candidatus Kapabacteria bacterium]|nr:hypothetical protein [Candidatus Kapabacteria bacterium]
MKIGTSTLYATIAIVCATATLTAQPTARDHFERIARLLAADSVEAIADLVVYPLRRPNPLPNIRTREELIARYTMLFDAELRDQLQRLDTSQMIMRNGHVGILAGEIWIDEDGRIIAVNHSTAEELAAADELTKRIKAGMHRSVREFSRNVLVYQCPKHLVRIDETRRGLRLATWNRGRGVHLKPDLVLYNGTMEHYGTQGGIGYTFTNGRWTYLVERIDMCGDEGECGPYLTIKRDGTEMSSDRCEESK